MSTTETIHCWLSCAENTQFSGESLARSLYDFPLEIFLRGELGAGKTTFLRGLAHGLHIPGPIVSPTFALEQRYHTGDGTPFFHIDLYRLTPRQAQILLESTDDHTGIRCIEWANRLESKPDGPSISIQLQEEGEGRALDITFEDCPLPSDNEIDEWRREVRLPPHIADHCETVARVCDSLSADLLRRGILVRPMFLRQAARLHDLLRFIDFLAHAKTTHVTSAPEDETVWTALREHFQGQHHEEACATFLRERGYEALASVIAVHGAHTPTNTRKTIEQQLLYYADKRAALDTVVTLEGRVQDFIERHGPSASELGQIMLKEAKVIEQTFFPHGPPM